MKASHYHQEWGSDPVLDKLAEYTETYPTQEDALADIDWRTDDDEIFFYQDIEELTQTDFSDEALDSAFVGDLKVAHLVELLSIMEKNARITTQAERIRMKQYRMKNKAKLRRKARIRRRKEKSGMRRRKKRVGTAAGGYTFITAPPKTPKSKRTSTKSPAQPRLPQDSGTGNYAPDQQTTSTERRSKLKPL